ncbi:hypothetical protein L6452_27928 [Arctium lappa]|uniref:Uncharacterized protein n=1 Tax=Arctium lappa TaxID=4217 RepID=A0ACB8ZWW0_ARCLA|nr:hypothetical protein L6452_27928 [Arctium lappa]
MASISDLIKTTIQASVPSVSAPSATQQPPARTAEDLITKSDLASFKSAIMSRMLTCSSKISTIAQKQVKATLELHHYKLEDQVAEIRTAASEAIESIQKVVLDPKGKGIAEPDYPKYKRKFSGGTCGEAAKKARFDDSEDSDDDEASESPKGEIKEKSAHTSAPPTKEVQEKEPERNTTSADDNQTLQTFTTPVTLLASSTSGVPITPIINATQERIGALEEE